MSEANAPTTNVTAESGLPSLDERIDSVFGPAESVGDADSPQPPAADAASPADSAAPDPIAKARAERRAKLAELNARSRASVDSKAAQREAEELRKQLAQRDAEIARRVDPSSLDPLKIIELGQRAGHTPQAIAEALRNAMGSPELAAQYAARQVVDPEIAAIKQSNAELKAQLEEFKQQQQASIQQAQEQAAAESFANFTKENASTSPYAAWFLQTKGPDQFLTVAKGAADAVPPQAGPQALLDEIEDRLIAIYGETPPNIQRPQANTPRTNPAAAQAPTHVTNTHAQGRSGVVDGHAALAKMSLIERANLAFDDG